MENDLFERICKFLVSKYFNEHKEKTDSYVMTPDDTYVVWSCKTLQNNKAMVSTTVSDGMYYEVTHNGDKHQVYVDAYKKWENQSHEVNNILKEMNEQNKDHEEVSKVNEDN